jgi:hypothetical protein
MDSIYFLIMLIGVFWLALWGARDHERPMTTWWPFDMASSGEPVAEADDTLPPWRRRPPPPRSGRG